MDSFFVRGGRTLAGRVRTAGSKNSVLPCLAAGLLTNEHVRFVNAPRLADDWAADATPTMFVAISPEPVAASPTDRDISLVVAVCSSTADAMVIW